MDIMLSILTGLIVTIPLIVQLVKYVKISIEEKNFGNIMKIVLDLMPEAEEKFTTGVERKQYVMNNIEQISKTLGYKVDFNKVSDMIDAICTVTKLVNK